MSLATANGAPDAKKFRFALPTQVVVNPLFDSPQEQGEACQQKSSPSPPVKDEAKHSVENLFKLENPAVPSTVAGPVPEDTKDVKPLAQLPAATAGSKAGPSVQQPLMDFSLAMLFQQANALFKQNNVNDGKPNNLMVPPRVTPTTPICTTPPAPIPGALAVAASPAAQLFGEDDWSWHRNPAAAIRSGGTNKQTPVWKYFVYNKAENLSRCIIGDCTYMLKGPHTSTLACHLKKHPAEYAEFQKLKVEYSRERQQTQPGSSASSTSARNKSSSATGGTSGTPSSVNSGASTPTSGIHAAANNLLKNIKLPDLDMKLNGAAQPMPTSHGSSNGRSQLPQQPLQQNGRNSVAMNDILQMYARAAASFPAFAMPPNFPLAQAAATAHSANQAHTESSSAPNTASVSVTQSSAPSNPLFMNLVKNSLVPPTAAANAANELLQQTRKWQRQDRKQKELEVKLALMFSTAQLPYAMVKNPFFRDFMETVQPKFTIPETAQIDELINAQFARTIAAVKAQLASASKFSLMIDVLKMNTSTSHGQNGDSAFGEEEEASQIHEDIRLCVSVVFFNKNSQQIDVALLGIRQIPFSSLPTPTAIRTTVEMLLYEYDLDMDKVSRVLVCGMDDVCEESCFPRELKPYNQKLLQSLAEVFEVDDGICALKKAFYDMLINFTSRPESMRQLGKLIGRPVEFPITEPFLNLAQYLLEIKEAFLTVCCQQPFDNPVEILSDAQWTMLEEAVRLLSLYRAHTSLVRDDNYVTIDRVVPSLMQMQMSLGKDFPALEDLANRLSNDLELRLAYITNPDADDFDGSFVQATALNPQLAMLLDEAQTGYAKSAIEKLLYERIRHAEDAMARRNGLKAGGVDALLAAVVERKCSSAASTPNQCAISPTLTSSTSSTSSETQNTPTTASSLYPDLMQMVNQRRKQNNEKAHNGKNLYAEAMVQAYFEDIMGSNGSDGMMGDGHENHLMASMHNQLPPLQYWQLSSVKCAQLSEIAIELLSVPSCTISLERIFSVNATDGIGASEFSTDSVIKAFDDPSRVERDAILRFNRNYIPKSS